MTKNEFLQLFELNEIYKNNKNQTTFSYGLHDRLTGSGNFVFFGFYDMNNIKISIECFEFSETKQQLEIYLLINNEQIELNSQEILKNELFLFLNFDTDLYSSLKFLANFINKILIPKYHLMGRTHIH